MLDVGVILEGEAELELDSKATRRMKKGDTIVQRGSIHKFTNITPSGGWLRMFFVTVDAKPILINGNELPETILE